MGLKFRSGNTHEENKYRVCSLCKEEIKDAHVEVTTRTDEYCVHLSCIGIGIVLIIGGITSIIQSFKRQSSDDE